MIEQSLAQTLVGRCSSGGVGVTALRGGGSTDRRQGGCVHLSLTPVKNPTAASSDVPARINVFEESPRKRTAGVAFTLNEEEEVLGGMTEKRRKSSAGEYSRVAASTSGMMTELGFSHMDAMVGHDTSAIPVGATTLGEAALGFELPPKEKFVSGKEFSQWSKIYPSQSTKTLFQDIFELNLPTILDLCHATTSVGTKQVIHFARELSLEVTLAS